ncbi:MAG TPA: TldD/PmbA family protein [Terriglobales bacterium]|nr:TldD/PmbA family protein [Terriglobales bacterium]
MNARVRAVLFAVIVLTVAVDPLSAQKKSVSAGKKSASSALQSSPVLQAMKDELTHSLDALKGQSTPPYFLSYEIGESNNISIVGSFGTITRSNESRRRLMNIDLRVGDFKVDNTRALRGSGQSFDFADRFSFIEIPIEDDPAAIRTTLWYHTDQKYKRAVEQLTKVKTNMQVQVEQEDKSADFSQEPPETYTEKLQALALDRHTWEEKIRKYTAPFARYGDIYEANAVLSASAETRWFVSNEGSQIQTSQTYYRLFISAFTKADDGMELPRYESFFAFTPEGLPDDAAILKAVDKMIQDLRALRTAPVVEPYTGPAILSGRASGVFFHEVFGHRIEGHRQKRVEEGQTFKKMVNDKVLPDSFSVVFDPTLYRLGNQDLVGAYRYDDEGVKARRLSVVENGVFKNFLMSRTPIDGFPGSNGHGRNQAGFAPVARQSNLIVQASSPVTRAELKKMLLEQIQKENKPFGLLFDDIQGGFTITTRTIPNAFNVLPVMVYRIYPDGKEELVRGVDLIGTPLTTFSKILAADDQVGVFNGVCGAESGWVPVSAVSPGILLSQIEVQKKSMSQERPPLLPAPFAVEK